MIVYEQILGMKLFISDGMENYGWVFYHLLLGKIPLGEPKAQEG